MKCELCKMRAELVCRDCCTLLCSAHLTKHSKNPGEHNFECIDRPISSSKLRSLKKDSVSMIKALKQSKHEIHLLSNHLIKKIDKYSKSALTKLDEKIQFYIKLMGLQTFSKSLEKEVDKVISSELKIKKIKTDAASLIKKAFDQEIVFVDKKPEPEANFVKKPQVNFNSSAKMRPFNVLGVNTARNFTSNLRIGESMFKSPFVKVEDYQEESILVNFSLCNSSPDNRWPMHKKKSYIESCKISDYMKNFGPDKISISVTQILFSYDGKFAFVCNLYSDFTNTTVKNTLCCKIYSDSIWIYNLVSKLKEWPQGMTAYNDLLKEAQEFWKRYPECYHEHGDYRKWF